jgi:hypothetical protein
LRKTLKRHSGQRKAMQKEKERDMRITEGNIQEFYQSTVVQSSVNFLALKPERLTVKEFSPSRQSYLFVQYFTVDENSQFLPERSIGCFEDQSNILFQLLIELFCIEKSS